MKLFTKDIDKKLFAQYETGSELDNQVVVAKIFNPYGRGTWYIINSDPSDPDYLWAIVDLFEVEVGSVSRSELENIKVPPFRLGLERDMYFEPVNAAQLLEGLMSGERYKDGGQIDIAEQNKDMLLNYAEELEKNTEEFEETAKKAENVEPWVVAKIERSTTDLSDVTNYLHSENEKRREYGDGEGEEMAKGGRLMGKGDAVIYDDETHYITEKNGVVGLVNMKQGAWGSNFPFTPLSKIDVSKEVTDMYGEKVKIPTKFKSGGMTDGEYGSDKHRIYFSSFAEVMDAINDIADENGYKVVDIFPDLSYGGVSYGQTRKAKVELEWNGKEKVGKSKKREKNTMNVQIYRMDSGNYELNTYFSYEHGGKVAQSKQDELLKSLYPQIEKLFSKNGLKLDKDYGFTDGSNKSYLPQFSYQREGDKLNKVVVTYYADGFEVLGEIEIELEDGVEIEIEFPNWNIKEEEKGFMEKGGYMADGGLIKPDKPIEKMNKLELMKFVSKIDPTKHFYPKTTLAGRVQAKNIYQIYLDGKTSKMAKGGVMTDSEYKKRIKKFGFKPYGKTKGIYTVTYIADGKNQSEKHESKEMAISAAKRYSSPKLADEFSDVKVFDEEGKEIKMAKGGVTFADKVKSIKSSLLKRKKVSPKVQKDYGKTYSPAEAEDSAKRIVGAMTAKERLMKRIKKGKK
jgi:hypothetical protein